MEKEEIIGKFKEKGYDNYSIDLLLEFINDFDDLGLTKYLPIEEVIDRICRNIDTFEYGKESREPGELGYYSPIFSKIVICKNALNDNDKISSVLFHELLHCISLDIKNDSVGFNRSFLFDSGESFEIGRRNK